MMAGIIQCHHRLEGGEESGLTERTLLFLADKMTLEDRMVDIDERFRQSAPKCTTPQARENHRLQYNQAQAVRHCLESAMGSLEAADAFGTSPRHLWTGRRGYGNGLPAEHKEMKSHGRK